MNDKAVGNDTYRRETSTLSQPQLKVCDHDDTSRTRFGAARLQLTCGLQSSRNDQPGKHPWDIETSAVFRTRTLQNPFLCCVRKHQSAHSSAVSQVSACAALIAIPTRSAAQIHELWSRTHSRATWDVSSKVSLDPVRCAHCCTKRRNKLNGAFFLHNTLCRREAQLQN